MTTRISLVLLPVALATFLYCNTDQHETIIADRGNRLHQRGQSFFCKLQELGKQSQSLWDSVARDLRQAIPDDFPEEDKNEIIEVRNAGLIKMFEAFPRLPAVVRQKIEEAETKEQELTAQMRIFNDSLRQYDREVGAFLENVKMLLPDSLESWQKRLVVYRCE